MIHIRVHLYLIVVLDNKKKEPLKAPPFKGINTELVILDIAIHFDRYVVILIYRNYHIDKIRR